MPLIIVCGTPCSGKSKRSTELQIYFEKNEVKSILIQDDNVTSDFIRNEVYSSAQKEKELRSSLKSQVERHLSKDTVVILDSGNYIKGYRYELYCLSKSCKTTHCLVHSDVHPDDCWSFNESRVPPIQYDRSVFDALNLRFEAPDSRNRWDAPLFTIHKDEDLPLKDIQDALFLRKAPPPNLSTQNPPLSATNYLYDLDKVTQGIIKAILAAQKTCEPGDSIDIPDADFKLTLTSPLTAGELARIRRQYISYTKNHPVADWRKIPNMFVQFIQKNI